MKVLLIQPASESRYILTGRAWWRPPLGLGYLASSLQNAVPDVTVRIWDELVQGPVPEDTFKHTDVVGISVNLFCLPRGVCLSRLAKRSGVPRVVLGGPGVDSPEVSSYLLRQPDGPDAVIRGDGEEAIVAIAKGLPWEQVPNAAYFSKSGELIWPIRPRPAPIGPVPFLVSEDLEAYFARQAQEQTPGRALSISTRRGCRWAAEHGRCSYCKRPGLKFRLRSPSDVAHEVEMRVRAHGVNIFWDVSDESVRPLGWWGELRSIAEERGWAHSVRWIIYGRADEIDVTAAQTLKESGVREIIIGFESGSQRILDTLSKGLKVEQSRRAAEILGETGIQVLACFMLGCPGESGESLNETVQLATELARVCDLSAISVADFVPMPGTKWFQRLEQMATLPDNLSRFDPVVLVHEFRRKYVEATEEEVNHARKELEGLSPRRHGFFRLRTETEASRWGDAGASARVAAAASGTSGGRDVWG